MKISFVGAGPGAPDLITVRGKELLEKADIIVYAGSLVNPALTAVSWLLRKWKYRSTKLQSK